MKKGKFLLAIAMVIFVAFITMASLSEKSVSFAEQKSIYGGVIYADESHYVYLNTPTYIAYSDSTIAIVDGSTIKAKGTYHGTVTGFTYSSINQMEIFSNILFVIYIKQGEESYSFAAFNLENGNAIQNGTDVFADDGIFPRSISIDKEKAIIYALYDHKDMVKAYDIQGSDGSYSPALKRTVFTGGLNIRALKQRLLFVKGKGASSSGGYLYFINHNVNNVAFSIIKYNLTIGEFDSTQIALDAFVSTKEQYLGAYGDSLIVSSAINELRYTYVIGEDNNKIQLTSPTANNSFKGICTSNDKLFISNTTARTVDVYTINGNALSLVAQYGSGGLSDIFLTQPSMATIIGTQVFIADKGNNRVVKYDLNNDYKVISTTNTKSNISSLQSIYSNEKSLFVLDGNDSVKVFTQSLEFVTEYKTGIPVTKICVDNNGTIYALDSINKKILVKYSDKESFETLMTLGYLPDHISVSSNGYLLYLTTQDKCIPYRTNGEAMPFNCNLQENAIGTILGISADYAGNLILLHSGAQGVKLAIFKRHMASYELVYNKAALSIDQNEIGFDDGVGVAIDDKGNILCVNKRYNVLMALYSANSGLISTKANDTYVDPTDISEPLKVVATGNTTTLMYLRPNNYQEIIEMPASSLAVVLNDNVIESGESYYYISYMGQKGYISSSGLTLIESTSPIYSKGVIRHRTVKLYSMPIESDEYLISEYDDKKMIFDINKRIGYISDDVYLGFLHVTCKDVSGYVRADSISIFQSLEYASNEPTYARVKATKLGSRVPLYASANDGSDVLASLSDSSKVVLLQEIDNANDYTLVRYNDIEGYVTTSSLYKNGLSTVQIIAIVMVIAVTGVSVLFFFISRRLRA